MRRITLKRYSGKWTWWLLGGGVFCSLFLGGVLLGIPLLLAGIYRLTARWSINCCRDCGYHYEILPEGRGA